MTTVMPRNFRGLSHLEKCVSKLHGGVHPVVPLKAFTWDKEKRMLETREEDVAIEYNDPDWVQTTVFFIRSHVTNKIFEFEYVRFDNNEQCWVFIPGANKDYCPIELVKVYGK